MRTHGLGVPRSGAFHEGIPFYLPHPRQCFSVGSFSPPQGRLGMGADRPPPPVIGVFRFFPHPDRVSNFVGGGPYPLRE